MSIPLNGAGKYKQGYYKPVNPKKYIGKETPVYRSSMELAFFLFCDRNPNILEWSSENVIIPYKSPLDDKIHKYYVDGLIAIKEGNIIKKYLIEIKPKKQTQPPSFKPKTREKTKVYETKQWIQNQAKWESAKKWAAQKGVEFMILTEEHLR